MSSTKPTEPNPKRQLFDALIQAYCNGEQLADTLFRLGEQWERDPKGPEKHELPVRNAREFRAKVEADIAAKQGPGVSMSWGQWVPLLEAVSTEYPAFNKSVDAAVQLVGGVAKDMDDRTLPALQWWTYGARKVLAKVQGCCQVNKWGTEGHRFWMQPPDDPKEFRAALAQIPTLTHELWCAGAGEGPEPGLPLAVAPVKARVLTDDEVGVLVGDYIRKKRSEGVNIERLTRDGIADATGVAAGRVSGSGPWKALAEEKRLANLKERPTPDTVSPADAALERLSVEEESKKIDWKSVLKQQERDQKKPNRDR